MVAKGVDDVLGFLKPFVMFAVVRNRDVVFTMYLIARRELAPFRPHEWVAVSMYFDLIPSSMLVLSFLECNYWQCCEESRRYTNHLSHYAFCLGSSNPEEDGLMIMFSRISLRNSLYLVLVNALNGKLTYSLRVVPCISFSPGRAALT